MKAPVPIENEEQATLAEWLDLHGVLWCHCPNEGQMGGRRGQMHGARLRRLGLKSGVPDVLVFDLPPMGPRPCRGVAIELKRQRGGRVSDEQREWIDALRERGWVAEVCKGAGAAIALLERLGYGRRAS